MDDKRIVDVGKVLGGLKDFQLRTAEYVFDRLFDATDPAHRFLVADEVGLGKTLVARGVLAKTIEHLWDKVERLDIIYICSNADIARQNINRLNVAPKKDFLHATRLTYLPIMLSDIRNTKLNFVSFTPGTSFDMKGPSVNVTKERCFSGCLIRPGCCAVRLR